MTLLWQQQQQQIPKRISTSLSIPPPVELNDGNGWFSLFFLQKKTTRIPEDCEGPRWRQEHSWIC
jgi:hypothetical protein